MRSEDEEDEDEYYDENEEEEDEGMNQNNNGIHGDDDDDENGDDDDAEDGSDEEGSEDDNADEEGDEADDDDEDEDEDLDVDIDVDDEEEEDGEENDDEDGDGDEGEHENGGSTDDEGEGEGGGEKEGEGEDVDMIVDGAEDEAGSSHPSQRSKAASKQSSTIDLPPPPHLVRRSLFVPKFQLSIPLKTLSIEAIVGIPLPSAVHSLASTSCLSYLLAGSQDGYVRAYDFWGSVNGVQMMTAQQRSVVGLGETVSKAGVGRGWWANEVEGITGGVVGKRSEPVYSMACEGDGLWALTGTQSGPINLYSLRHSPGYQIHSLKGHTNVVSCMALLPSEKGFMSGSWDGTVREWDLNTGQTVRSYPTHGAQLSSLSFRPFSHPPSPTPSPRRSDPVEDGDGGEDDQGPRENISISMGPDFFEKRVGDKVDEKTAESVIPAADEEKGDEPKTNGDAGAPAQTEVAELGNDDIAMSEPKSPASMDSLFGGDDDEDAEGETVPSSIVPTTAPTPLREVSPSLEKPKALGLALPGQSKIQAPAPPPSSLIPQPPSSVAEQPTPSSSSAPLFVPHNATAGPSNPRLGAASNIPLLSPTSYKAFSNDVLLSSSMDGQVVLIDRRVPDYEGAGVGVGRLQPGDRAPPWCMSASWLSNGNQVLAGRRNGTMDVWDVRKSSSSSAPNLLRTLRTPTESGPISCVVAFQDGKHIASASQDNIRLWNTAEYFDPEENMKRSKSKPPFKIIAGHHGGTISSMIVDPTGRFLVTASGDRGWQGESTKVVLIHEIKW